MCDCVLDDGDVISDDCNTCICNDGEVVCSQKNCKTAVIESRIGKLTFLCIFQRLEYLVFFVF